jgi:hypothetical protein
MPETLRQRLTAFVSAQPEQIEIHQAELHETKFAITSQRIR